MESKSDRRLFTVDEVLRMDEAGLFQDEHVELIHGEILVMPKGSRHQARVDRANAVMTRALGSYAIVRIQGPFLVDKYNLPEPDVMLIKSRPDYYEHKHPGTADVLLIVEIADSSLERDLEVKLALYAIAGIQEYWIEDVQRDVLLVFRNPIKDGYRTALTLHRNESIAPLAFPDIHVNVGVILG